MPESEPTIAERVDDRPAFEPKKIADVRARELLYRFLAGALTSIAAGGATLGLGARLGGILLAFPAILAASLTLIEQQEDSVHAREDARGATAGAVALVLFAVAAALTLGHLAAAMSLLIATVVWLITAILVYVVSWWR